MHLVIKIKPYFFLNQWLQNPDKHVMEKNVPSKNNEKITLQLIFTMLICQSAELLNKLSCVENVEISPCVLDPPPCNHPLLHPNQTFPCSHKGLAQGKVQKSEFKFHLGSRLFSILHHLFIIFTIEKFQAVTHINNYAFCGAVRARTE